MGYNNNDKSILENHLSRFFTADPRLISEDDITQFKIKKLKNRAPKTGNNILTVLASILNYGVENKKIPSCPKIKKFEGIDNATYLGFLNSEIISELKEFIKGASLNSYIFQYVNGNRIGVDYIQDNLQRLFNCLFNKGLVDKNGKVQDRKNIINYAIRGCICARIMD